MSTDTPTPKMENAIARIALALDVGLEFARGNAAKTLTLAADTIIALREEVSRAAAQVPRPVPEGEDARIAHVLAILKEAGVEPEDGESIGSSVELLVEQRDEARNDVARLRGDTDEILDDGLLIARQRDDLAARIEALEAERDAHAREENALAEENARLREEALTKDAALSLLGGEHKALVEAHNARVRTAQSTPRPTVDSGAPSGLDETKPPPRWHFSPEMYDDEDEPFVERVAECCELSAAHDVYRRESAPAVAAATATLVAERDAALVKWVQCAAHISGEDDFDTAHNMLGLDVALRLFPAGPRAEREQADGG